MTAMRWLHLTDLHRGLTGQRTLWPNIEDAFFEDLRRIHDRCGPWDLIFFTGDLVQSGEHQQYLKLDETLGRLYRHLERLGSKPILLFVPGNHDLVRPDVRDASVKLLAEFPMRKDVSDAFWFDTGSGYRTVVENAFTNFTRWSTHNPFPKPAVYKRGMLPGDFSASIAIGQHQIGIVGLNSTFLQLTGGDYFEHLVISLDQLQAVCGEYYTDWVRRHHFIFLLTHQPVEWLSKPAKQVFEGEIAVPGRFIAHLFGHMHEPQERSVKYAGEEGLRFWQGASLFGLETYGNEIQRIHGYDAGRLDIGDGTAILRRWPRRAVRQQSGKWQIIREPSAALDQDEGTASESVSVRQVAAESEKAAFHVALLSTDTDLKSARLAVGEYIERALGARVTHNPDDMEAASFDLVILLQAWWWDEGLYAKRWQEVRSTEKIALVVDENSDWPPRRLSEANAQSEVNAFRHRLSAAIVFSSPSDLPEKVGALVTERVRIHTGTTELGLREWERSYLAIRIPAWRAGRTALGRGRLIDSETSEELFQPELYVSLEGEVDDWQENAAGVISRRTHAAGALSTEGRSATKLPVARWLSTQELPRVVLVGAPGGGKTIVLTRIAAELANACLGRRIDLEPQFKLTEVRTASGAVPIPILLEATRVAGRTPLGVSSLVQALADEIESATAVRPDTERLVDGLRAGRYLLLMDGLDEVPDQAARSSVLDLLASVGSTDLFPATRLVVTTRSARYTGRLHFEENLSVVRVIPFDGPKIRQFCAKWSKFRARDDEFKSALATAVAGISEAVERSEEELHLASNPLMLTAICIVYERYRSLPDDRGRLCELLVDDLCRSRRSEDHEHGWKFDDSQKKDLLQRIALAMQQEGVQSWPISRAIGISLLTVPAVEPLREQRAKKQVDWTADHTGILRFSEDPAGGERIRFWHRVFREYLSASALSRLDLTAADIVQRLWTEGRLLDRFWDDVIMLLPRAFGTFEKAQIFREAIQTLAGENPVARGRLLGLIAASIIENRDLSPSVSFPTAAKGLAEIYESEGLSWPLLDRLLFLEALGRLDMKDFDPRVMEGRFVPVLLRADAPAPKTGLISVGWSEVTAQEYWKFVRDTEFRNPNFWLPIMAKLDPVDIDVLADSVRRQLRHPNWPVVNIGIQGAVAFCRWRTLQRTDGNVVRLPTVSEWQQGIKPNAPENELNSDAAIANVGSTGLGHPNPVGLYAPTAIGTVDVVGNVWEWAVREGFAQPDFKGPHTKLSPFAVVGGAFDRSETDLRPVVAIRRSERELLRVGHRNVGFRCAVAESLPESWRELADG